MTEDRATRLRTLLQDPGYTPRRKDVGPLVELMADAEPAEADRIERVVLAHAGEVVDRSIAMWPTSPTSLRPRLVHLLGRIAGEAPAGVALEPVWEFLFARLDDEDFRVRRSAAAAVGRSSHERAEDALLELWHRETRVDVRKAVVLALGRVGGARTRALVRRVASSDEALQRALEEAALMVERAVRRNEQSWINGKALPRTSTTLELRCKPGLEALCAAEFEGAWVPTVAGPGRVRVMLRGPLESVLRSRVMQSFAVALPSRKRLPGVDLGDLVIEAILSREAIATFEAFTTNTVRYRIEWEGAGHRRGMTWRCVRAIAARCPSLVNDPRDSTWEVAVREQGGEVHTLLRPLRLDDPRFAYRKAEVPAASHPTVAAALARVAGVDPSDVVWDPFVGSALELVERARLGPYARMLGGDTDARALEAARSNLAAAGVERVELMVRDAMEAPPEGVTLLITNPPMGHRVGFGTGVNDLLRRFVQRAATSLAPGGRMVWLAPLEADTARAAEAAGLTVHTRQRVDLGGLGVELQRFDRPR